MLVGGVAHIWFPAEAKDLRLINAAQDRGEKSGGVQDGVKRITRVRQHRTNPRNATSTVDPGSQVADSQILSFIAVERLLGRTRLDHDRSVSRNSCLENIYALICDKTPSIAKNGRMHHLS